MMYTVNGESFTEDEVLSFFDEYLDETMPSWWFGNIEYMPSSILKEVDPICYRCEFNNWLDMEEIV